MANRPLSPDRPRAWWYLWRPHLTMFASFATRISGIAAYAGVFVAVAWAVCLASGPEPYGAFRAVMGSAPAKAVLFGMTLAAFFHLGGGIRHLIFDFGYGFDLKTANRTAAAVPVFAVLASIAFWLALPA